jgi:hypothetical protein
MSGTERQGTPFPFEGPVDRALLIDRRDELTLLARRAADRVGVRLVAPRRFGKTSLTLAHAEQLRESGWRTAHVDFSRVADLTDVARRFAAAYAELDLPWMRSHLTAPLARLGLTLTPAGPGVSWSRRPASSDPEAAELVLHRLLDLPLALWREDQTPTLVVLDEFQDLLTARDDLDGLLRSRIQYHRDAAAYVYAGSEPSMMHALFDKRERPFFGQADPLDLGPLPFDEAIEDLSKRYEAEDQDPGEALGELVGFAGGHPQRTMMLAYLLSERLAEGAAPTPALAAEVIASAIARTRAAHQALWGQLQRQERVALAAISDGTAPTSRALAVEHDLSPNTLSRAAERLADRGHVVRDERGSRVVDPLLREWLRQR